MFTTSQSYLQIAAKSKLNTICQEANHQIWQLMAEEIQKIGPEMFLHAIYCYNIVHYQEFTSSGLPNCGDCVEGAFSRVHVKFSRTIDTTKFGSSVTFGSPRLPSYRPTSQAYGSSDDSCSSQSTSPYLPTEGHYAPVASMIRDADSLGVTSEPLWNQGETTQLSLPSPAPQVKRPRGHGIGKIHKAKRLHGKYDPENHEIMRLRQKEDLEFQEIADKLNEARNKNGGKDELTDNAVYSRYTRNAPLIAQLKNEKFAPTPKDNLYTKMKFPKVEPISGFDPHEDSLLEAAEQQIQEQFWTLVSKRIQDLGGRYHDPEMCERRFEYL